MEEVIRSHAVCDVDGNDVRTVLSLPKQASTPTVSGWVKILLLLSLARCLECVGILVPTVSSLTHDDTPLRKDDIMMMRTMIVLIIVKPFKGGKGEK